MDDEEHHLSILSLRFWRVGSSIICYFYCFSYLYMPLYHLYDFSIAFMFVSKPARSVMQILLQKTGNSNQISLFISSSLVFVQASWNQYQENSEFLGFRFGVLVLWLPTIDAELCTYKVPTFVAIKYQENVFFVTAIMNFHFDNTWLSNTSVP